MTNMTDLEKIYKEAIEDVELLGSIDVDALLEKIGENHYLENKDLDDISREIFETVSSVIKDDHMAKSCCMRLTGFRLVDRVCDLRNWRLIRWIKGGSLTNGGLLMNVKIENKGVVLLCRNNVGRFFNVRFDDCVIFQKLTMEEQIVLMAGKGTEGTEGTEETKGTEGTKTELSL